MIDRIRIILVIAFFIGLVVMTSVTQDQIVAQKDPATINVLAGGYTPGQIRPTGSPPVQELGRIREEWEQLARQRHQDGVEGFQRPWKLRFLEMPNLGPSQESWALTRLMGGTAPEIMRSMTTPDYSRRAPHWYIDLTDYLDRPNPYVPGNRRWADIFYPSALQSWTAGHNNHSYGIPIDQVEVGIFYNKDILRRCGIREQDLPPETWQEFLDIQQKIRDAGEIPFLMPAAGPMRIDWVYRILFDQIYDTSFDELNVVARVGEPRAGVSKQEIIRGLKRGLIEVGDDRYFAIWQIIKDWSRYWQDGFLGDTDTIRFQQGKVAMTIDGSWVVTQLANRDLDFEYGVFLIPPVTKETTRWAHGIQPRGVGGATAVQFSITKETARNKGAVEACVDFLMYLTAPQNLGPMVAEVGSFLPAVRGAELTDELKFMVPVLERGAVRIPTPPTWLTPRAKHEWWVAMQLYLIDKYDRDKVRQVLSDALDRAIAQNLEEYAADWRFTEDWEIIPAEDERRVGPAEADHTERTDR
jgi:ABC-type glycerol-3-phosphate transport system substrate-binding protein